VSSTLARLFHLAKATKAEARENFTTEALAAAIRSEPLPFVRALAELGIIVDEAAGPVTVQTQVPMVGAGILDLVVEHGPVAGRRSIWVEVKIYASESGNQLDRYVASIADQPLEQRPVLLVLGRRRLRADVPLLSWQAVRRAVLSSGTRNSWWLDLQEYLKELGMADDYDDPITQTDVAAILPAHQLLGKTARILRAYVENAKVIWPNVAWPADEAEIRRQLVTTFLRLGTFAVSIDRGPHTGVSAGVYRRGGDGAAGFGLRIWARPKSVMLRAEVLRLAAKAGLGESWRRDPAEWEILGAYCAVAEFSDPDAAAAWLIARLLELKGAGLLALVENPKNVSPVTDDGGDVEGG
jgi:hypothetical protein